MKSLLGLGRLFPPPPQDFAYANGDQSKWDAWQEFMEPLSSKTPILANAGTHETLNEPGFVAFRTRFGAMPFESPRFDDSGSLFYSTEVGAMHIVCLSAFSDFSETSVQTFFLINDLASVNRTRTPWLIAAFHAPWYNSNKNHYLTAEAMRVAYEPILLAARVNIVMVGHVHAFQRTPLVGADGEVMPVESGLGAYHWMVGISGKSLYANWVPEEFPEPQPSGKPSAARPGASRMSAGTTWATNCSRSATPRSASMVWSSASEGPIWRATKGLSTCSPWPGAAPDPATPNSGFAATCVKARPLAGGDPKESCQTD